MGYPIVKKQSKQDHHNSCFRWGVPALDCWTFSHILAITDVTNPVILIGLILNKGPSAHQFLNFPVLIVVDTAMLLETQSCCISFWVYMKTKISLYVPIILSYKKGSHWKNLKLHNYTRITMYSKSCKFCFLFIGQPQTHLIGLKWRRNELTSDLELHTFASLIPRIKQVIINRPS